MTGISVRQRRSVEQSNMITRNALRKLLIQSHENPVPPTMTDSLKITLWNVQWAKGKRAHLVKARLFQCPVDVLCVTEGYPDMLNDSGHLISSDADHGYNTTDERRKVMLWSNSPWSSVDTGNEFGFPSGRFVSGITDTPLGLIRFVGVCIPWKSAHVSTGRRDREVWQDHMSYLDALEEWLNSMNASEPVILLGDFNQRIPYDGQSKRAYDRLMSVLAPRFEVVTDEVLAGVDEQSIDHVAVSSHFGNSTVDTFSKTTDDGMELSDHFGLRVNLRKEAV